MRTDLLKHRHPVDRPATMSIGCLTCEQFHQCGGMHRLGGGWKCTDLCDTGQCRGEDCDLVSPSHPDRYARAMVEVRGFGFENLEPFRGPLELPTYISGIAHGSFFKREQPDYLRWASVPLNRVICFGKTGWTERFEDGAALRRALKLPARTRLVLVCVGKDALIEPVWRHLYAVGFASYLKRLGFSAVIVPNFSFFENEPRTQHFYNRKRSLIVAEELSRHGIPVVPYFHAMEDADFGFWLELLRARPEIRFLAEEFQTGLKDRERGKAYIEGIAWLQRQLGRPLHLIAIGGVQHRETIARHFKDWTLIASAPFCLAASRLALRKQGSGFKRIRHSHARPADLVRHNHRLLEADCLRLRAQYWGEGRRPTPTTIHLRSPQLHG